MQQGNLSPFTMATSAQNTADTSEGFCAQCEDVLGKVKVRSQESCFLCMDIAVTVLNNKPNKKQVKEERKKERVNKSEELVKKVTALRNSKGGILLVHITGLDRGDRFLGYFDEFVDEKLNKLIEDGKQFVDTYSRVWLSDKPEFGTANSFVCLTVKSSSSISTTDFKTKIPLDSAIENPSTINILSLLAQRRTFSDRDPQIRGNIQNLAQLNESRNIQLKAFLLESKKREELLKDVGLLCEYIWKDLRLREYISAFTKVESGDHFFLESKKGNWDPNKETITRRSCTSTVFLCQAISTAL